MNAPLMHSYGWLVALDYFALDIIQYKLSIMVGCFDSNT